MDIWNFLNQNLISGIITTLLFSIILVSFLKKRESIKSKEKLLKKLDTELSIEQNRNVDKIQGMIKIFELNPALIFNNGFLLSNSILKILISPDYIIHTNPEITTSLIDLSNEIEMANILYTRINAMSSTSDILNYKNQLEKIINTTILKDVSNLEGQKFIFLSNSTFKYKFIFFLSKILSKIGIKIG